MIQDRLFKTGAAEQRPGRLMVSDKTADFDVLLMFNHGVGEAGDGTLTNLPRLWGNSVASGPLGFSTSDFIYKHPIDGKTYRFIIVALQGTKMDTDFHWCCFPWQIKYAIENDIKPLYPKIKAVFITGLSAGGAETVNSISDATYADLYTAAVPMSAASGGVDPSVTAKKNIPVWGFCGDNDWAYRPNVENFAKAVNAIKPGLARVSLYPGGHGGWDAKYNPSYKEGGQNIYEWMLGQYKPVDNPPTPIPPPPPAPKPTLVNIPLDMRRMYQINNFDNDLSGLFDGDINNRPVPGYGQIISPYEARYEFPDEQEAVIYKFRFYDGQGGFAPGHNLEIYGMTADFKRTLLATFDGKQYNAWVEANVAAPTQYKYLVMVIYSEGGGHTLPTEMELWGTLQTCAGTGHTGAASGAFQELPRRKYV
jgi:hypothetical protein